MRLEVLPAAKGDCLLLHHEQGGVAKLILIDGGPAGVYSQTLKPRLLAIRQDRIRDGVIGENGKLFIDLVVISHIDDDHINGIKALLEDMASANAPFRIGRLWHNSFDSLLDAESGQVQAGNAAGAVVTASLAPAPADDDVEPSDRHDLDKVLASVGQGYDVLGLARKLNIPINPEFNGKAIQATDGKPRKIDGLNITVLGPMKAELDALRADFTEWLAKRDHGDTNTASLLASFDDKSVPNLSSIVLLVEESGPRFLLTGDARGDKIMAAVKQFGLGNAKGEMPIDLLKVPHHGSNRNLTTGFFAAFPAPWYVFSGNGEHGNPERETLAFLAKARGAAPVTIELTYPPAEIDRGRAVDWKKRQKRNAKLAPFDPATMGIVSFLAAQPSFIVK